MSIPSDTTFDPYHVWLQVPKDARPPTHYQLLGLAVGEADPEVIRQATLMRSAYVRHFQTGPNAADATRILEELADASRVLLDPKLRAAYEAKAKPAPAPKAAPARPPSVSGARQTVVQPPPSPTVEYTLSEPAERRPKKKRRKARRSPAGMVLSVVAVGAALGALAYVGSAFFRSPMAAASKAEPTDQSKGAVKAGAEGERGGEQNGSVTAESKPATPPDRPARPLDAVTVRLSVEPPEATLTLEPIGDAPPGGPKASIEGEGSERTIVAEKGVLPVVVAASAPGHQPNRVTVFSSDAGRLVVVMLQKERGSGISGNGAPPGASFVDGSLPKGRRPVGGFRVGIPLSARNERPVWRYTATRPAGDWATNSFADVLWNEGQGAFGIRTGKDARKVPGLWMRTNWTSRDIWLRARVELPKEIKDARIRWAYRNDEGIHVYVNGVLQFSETGINYQTTTRVLDATAFQAGENIVGVHAMNTTGPGFVDVGFDWIATEEAK